MKTRWFVWAGLVAVGGTMISVGAANSRAVPNKAKAVKADAAVAPVQALAPVAVSATKLDPGSQRALISDALIGKPDSKLKTIGSVQPKHQPDAPMAGWTSIMTEGFEGTWPSSGWSVTGNFTYGGIPITWGPATYTKRSGAKAAWPHGSAADPAESWSFSAPSGYTVDSWATYGPFNLSDATDAILTFYLTYELGAGDQMKWLASIDDQSYYGYAQTGGFNWPSWSQVTFDLKNVPTLGNLCGQPAVYIALLYVSDATQDYNEGAYVDDILLQKYTAGEHCYTCGGGSDFGPYTPSTSYVTHTGSFAASGCRWYRFNLSSGTDYVFTFCEGGGTADADTTLTLYDSSCNQVGYSNDFCGTRSQLTYSPPTSGTFYLRVGENLNDGGLNYTLAYKGTPQPCGIQGRKWNDLNRNKVWDTGEPALSGFVIYLDSNKNGSHDTGEPSQTTDTNGQYQFLNLAAGDYTISEINQAGWTQTFPSAAAAPGPSTFGDNLTPEQLANLEVNVQDSPPKPPPGYDRNVATDISASAVMLLEVPTSTWTYGCSATSAGMLFGYYDRHGYSNMYAGPTNGGVAPLVNLGQGIDAPIAGSCSIIATQNGFDGRVTRGHVDDYWTGYNNPGPDPWEVNGWTEHTWGGCTADYMGTNQWKWSFSTPGVRDANSDGATTFFSAGSSKLFDYIPEASCGLPQTELCHGMRLFAESRGYTVVQNYTQGIDTQFSGGFTFNDYKAEINAGRPVLIQVVGHTMLGVGYDDSGSTVYLHDTWDNAVHSMTWGGSYSGMLHKYVTCIQLASSCPSTSHCVSLTPGTTATQKNFGNAADVVLGTINVDANPNSLNAGWTLQGPNSYSYNGHGDQTLSNMAAGSYTLTWSTIACYTAPSPNPASQTLLAGGSITFTGTYGAAAAPQASTWAIANTHGSTELYSIFSDGYVEPRGAGIKKLRITFDQAMNTSATAPGYVSIVGDVGGNKSSLIQGISWPNSTNMVVTLSSSLPDGDRYTVTLSPNLQSANGCPIGGNRSITIRALMGDVTGDRAVNVSDIIQIRDRRGQTVDANTYKFDVTCDNAINVSDIIVTRDCRGHSCP